MLPRLSTSVLTSHGGPSRLEAAFSSGPVMPESLNIEEMSIVLFSLVFPWAWLGDHKDGDFSPYIEADICVRTCEDF